MQVKRCPSCGETKTLALFYRSKVRADGCQSYCKVCCNLRSTSYARNNKEKIPTTGYTLKRRYGITSEEYLDLLKKQNNSCAVCKVQQEGKALAVDHCHTTGKVRGLLCSNCNIGLGMFKDDISLIEKGIQYLDKYNE